MTADENAGGSSAGSDAVADAAAPTDSTSDAFAAEGSVQDAGRGDAAPSGFCVGRQVAFCADFDRVVAPTDGWTTANVTAGAALDFDLVTFTSPPRALHSKVPAGTGLNTAASRLHKVVSTTLSRSILEFDCNVKSIGTSAGDWLLTIGWVGRNGTDEAFGLYARPGTWGVLGGAGQLTLAGDLPAPPQYGRFVHVTMEVVWSPTAGSVRVAFDGVTVFTRDAAVTALAGATRTVELAVGFQDAAGNSPASEMSIDNVTLRMQ
jgi:hypothetical protein